MSKARKNNNVRRIDRNAMAGPMSEFVRVENPKDAEDVGILATYENNRYGVFLKRVLSDGLAAPGPDGAPQTMEVLHLIIVRKDKKKTEISWGEKQAIKNELLGPMVEAMELFPSEMRRMGSIVDHQCHMWAFPPGAQIPIGLIPKAMQDFAREDALNRFTVGKEELELYVVEDGEVVQVFGSEDEAKKSYDEADNEMPEGKIGRIGDIPMEEDGVVWSNVAKVKVASVLEKSAQLDNLMRVKIDEPGEATRVNTNGPVTDQDELEDEHGVVDESPTGDEENVMMTEFMALGMDKMKNDRINAVNAAVEKLVVRMGEDEEKASKLVESEAEAKDELEAMREKMKEDRAKETN